jgi:hypothetical protein
MEWLQCVAGVDDDDVFAAFLSDSARLRNSM